MPTRPDQWYRQLQGDRLAPVQLLAGEELLVLEAADALRARARELGYDEREVIDVEARFEGVLPRSRRLTTDSRLRADAAGADEVRLVLGSLFVAVRGVGEGHDLTGVLPQIPPE